MPSLSYSADEIDNFISDGINHTIVKSYNYEETCIRPVDMVLVEGIGSDFTFFHKLFSDSEVLKPIDFEAINGGGKDNLMCALKENISKFGNQPVLLVIDFCGFGSNIEDLLNLKEI